MPAGIRTGGTQTRVMKPQRKLVNLFVSRSRIRLHPTAIRTNAMYGRKDERDEVIERTESTGGIGLTDQSNEIREGSNGSKGIEAWKGAVPCALPHFHDGDSGDARSPFTSKGNSDSSRTHQSESNKPDGAAQGEAVPAVSSVQTGISFRLKDGSSFPLPELDDDAGLNAADFAALKQLAQRFESIPQSRVTAGELPGLIGRWLRPLRRPAKHNQTRAGVLGTSPSYRRGGNT